MAARIAAAAGVAGGGSGGAGAGGGVSGGKESPAERQRAPASGSCNSPESDWADSRSESTPHTVET